MDDLIFKLGDLDARFSFDPLICATRIESDLSWNSIIQAHLYYDHIITKLISESLQKPKLIRLDRMSFSAKIDLVSALGVIQESDRGFLRKINNIRNRIAHDLHYKPDTSDTKSLYGLMTPAAKKIVSDYIQNAEDELLSGTLTIFALILDILRQSWADRRASVQEQKTKAELLMKEAAEAIRDATDQGFRRTKKSVPQSTAAPRPPRARSAPRRTSRSQGLGQG
jgi:hypothetical protein